MAKSKQETRSESIAVHMDARQESGAGGWLTEGAWVAVVCADPIYYGQVVAVTPEYVFLRDASWVPDTGRAHAFAEDPQSCTEAEYLGEIAIERPVVAVYRVRGTGGKLETK